MTRKQDAASTAVLPNPRPDTAGLDTNNHANEQDPRGQHSRTFPSQLSSDNNYGTMESDRDRRHHRKDTAIAGEAAALGAATHKHEKDRIDTEQEDQKSREDNSNDAKKEHPHEKESAKDNKSGILSFLRKYHIMPS